MPDANSGVLKDLFYSIEERLAVRGLPPALVDAYAHYIASLPPGSQEVQVAHPGGPGYTGPECVEQMQQGTKFGVSWATMLIRGSFREMPDSEKQRLIEGGIDLIVDALAEKTARDFTDATQRIKSASQ